MVAAMYKGLDPRLTGAASGGRKKLMGKAKQLMGKANAYTLNPKP